MAQQATKTIELWDGFGVDINEQLMDDFDFITDLSEAQSKNDIAALISMYMALIGGDKTYAAVRDHIEKEHGYFSQKALLEIVEKVNDAFPKSGNRAQRRSWKSSI